MLQCIHNYVYLFFRSFWFLFFWLRKTYLTVKIGYSLMQLHKKQIKNTVSCLTPPIIRFLYSTSLKSVSLYHCLLVKPGTNLPCSLTPNSNHLQISLTAWPLLLHGWFWVSFHIESSVIEFTHAHPYNLLLFKSTLSFVFFSLTATEQACNEQRITCWPTCKVTSLNHYDMLSGVTSPLLSHIYIKSFFRPPK